MVTLQLLRKIPVFAGIDDGKLREMSHICQMHGYASGEVIFRQGEPATKIFYLVQGGVDIRIDEKNALVGNIRPGQCFGWSALVPPNLFTASAIARGNCKVLVIEGAGLETHMREDGKICCCVYGNIAATISERLAVARRQLAAMLNPDSAMANTTTSK